MGRKKDLANALRTLIDNRDVMHPAHTLAAVDHAESVLRGDGQDLIREIRLMEVEIEELNSTIKELQEKPQPQKGAFITVGDFNVRPDHIEGYRKSQTASGPVIQLFLKNGSVGRVDVQFSDRDVRDIAYSKFEAAVLLGGQR